MTDATVGPTGALARLLETEQRLEAEVAEAAARAQSMVAEAREQAAATLRRSDEAVARLQADSATRREEARAAKVAAIEAEVERRIAAWRDLSGDRLDQLADWVVERVLGTRR